MQALGGTVFLTLYYFPLMWGCCNSLKNPEILLRMIMDQVSSTYQSKTKHGERGRESLLQLDKSPKGIELRGILVGYATLYFITNNIIKTGPQTAPSSFTTYCISNM